MITRALQVETIRPMNAEGSEYSVVFRQKDVDGEKVSPVNLVLIVPLSQAETMQIGGKYVLTLEEEVAE